MRGTQAKREVICLLAAGVVGLFAVQPVAAAQMDAMFGDMQSSFLYDSSGQEVSIPGAAVINAAATRISAAALAFPSLTATWSGSPLITDTSVGTLASADFGPGGTFTLTGTVLDLGNFSSFTGVLLTGTVGSFSIQEQSQADNFIDISTATYTPTGGALFDGTVSTTFPVLGLGFTGVQVMQNGGALQNFQSDIQFVEKLAFGIAGIPEPSTMLLLFGASAALVGRRRRS
ncbi:MAG: PEP-CTERM sorting domain-containing protein [Phycisphaerales bacterium]|nr:PEP-CTERM sorting domain-containing protein [Phycisphaerales bacterium]